MDKLLPVIGLALAFPLAVLLLMAFFMMGLALLPGRTARASSYLEGHPWRSLGLGAATAALMLLLLATLGPRLPKPVGILILLPLAGVGLVFPAGLGVAAELVGRRLLGLPELERRLASLLLGGGVTLGASALPFVGWFAILPLGALAGGGALVADALRPAPRPA